MDRRARYRAIGAIHAAVTQLRFEHGAASFTLVEPLASVRRHRLGLGVTACGTGQF
ncbi:MAG: hypothetical protein ITD45_04455 [Nitrosospira sp.]|nr:hypothetical protein [Nitrosospira sp.]